MIMAFDMDEFSRINRARCEAKDGFNHPLNGWSLSDWMTATFGELGEAANVAKKLNRVRDGIPGSNHTPEKLTLKRMLASELADTFIYLDLLAQSEGIDLPAAIAETFAKKSVEIGYKS
jgi:NTP pyrophosphatase (non-canonical NTP hydrolase)